MRTLKQLVYQANLDLERHKLVLFTWGNASAADHKRQLVAIKPSGLAYRMMQPEDMVIVDFDGNVMEGTLKPSSDMPTHLELYRNFPGICGVVHTHSTYATSWAQAQRDIPNVGTTHADYFFQSIPCTREMTDDEISGDYEKETGHVIVECLRQKNIDPLKVPGILVSNHGPFTWGRSVVDAVHHAVILEEIAKMAFITSMLNPQLPMNSSLIEKHFIRKHGSNAYYGQSNQ